MVGILERGGGDHRHHHGIRHGVSPAAGDEVLESKSAERSFMVLSAETTVPEELQKEFRKRVGHGPTSVHTGCKAHRPADADPRRRPRFGISDDM